jgi:hypothetical protein
MRRLLKRICASSLTSTYGGGTLRKRNSRFRGAGGSAEREFIRQRRQNVRGDWHVWLFVTLGVVGFATWSVFVSGVAGRAVAGTAGVLAGVLLAMWALGGHISAFRWWLGAEGERATAKEIERLGSAWHCEHDLEHAYGNWDHVVVGPPGVFLLDSKLLHGTAAAGGDALRSGRLLYSGGSFRGGAHGVKDAIERQLGWRAPWVQAVVVVWGDFPQARHDEENVIYVRGDELRPWLEGLPARLTGPQRAAVIAALREARNAVAVTAATGH